MKNVFIILSICLLHGEAQTQIVQKYSLYFDTVLRIEEAIANENFNQCISLYSQIFNEYERAFAKDAFNACQIAAIQQDIHFADFLFQCAKAGITKSILLNNKLILDQYQTDPELMDTVYSWGQKIYTSTVNASLRNEFINRYKLEQESKGKPEYKDICTENFNRILSLAKQNQFPGEHVIGVGEQLQNYVWPTLLHYPYAYVILEPYLSVALEEGRMLPEPVMYLYSFNQTRTSVLYTAAIPVDAVHFKDCYNLPFGKRSDDLTAVNQNRKNKKISSVETIIQLQAVCDKYRINYSGGY